ncbi:DUF58 domain-containing protein [Shewanella yunxiaonensis]|uniref:DUF58 domain-containing protein n=1 Tax=Shewanella yunxiaonensis TaxID=2829809 RepID=A0ABX7YYY6_9GAMM|nr:DUF58 domain-containing protein [Shewanella yunxiaonensis]QUN07386.1 DUF58 domain-containing protein [Shewanella yunxiaonensis]
MASASYKLSPWLHRWLNRRIPAAKHQRLSHRSIFILPSGFGLMWLLLSLLLFLFGTNYQNNLVIGLSLLLGSIFVSAILYSYRNLAGLRLSALPAPDVYAGETVAIPLKVTADSQLYQINLSYPAGDVVTVKEVASQGQIAALPLPTRHRGYLSPGRLLVESHYPLGLCRVWSWVDMDNPLLVFPAYHPDKVRLHSIPGGGEDSPLYQFGIDEFCGLKSWHPGESLKQVAWKQFAQGRGMLSKEFSDPHGDPVWLQLPANLCGEALEQALETLCWQVDQLAKQNCVNWGLQLDKQQLPPAAGEAQRIACLRALAVYQPLTMTEASDEQQ